MFYVDIPDPRREEWACLGEFKTREEAIRFAQEHLGADEEGRIGVVSQTEDDDEEWPLE